MNRRKIDPAEEAAEADKKIRENLDKKPREWWAKQYGQDWRKTFRKLTGRDP